ncbi:lithostathine-1-beta-like [Anolis sagrei]|uniref:lithostathine-1-beta-like n=1 Tax=Anolis sagrei TaxID=38937 RepID=UPI00351FD434
MAPVFYFGLCLLGCLAFSPSTEGVRDLSLPRPRSPCPAGTLYYRKMCYEYLSDPLSWEDAEDYCEYWRDGHLASIQSKAEENIISKYIKKTSNPSGVWIGFHATPQSSVKWEWTDGLAYPPGSALWDGRKPFTSTSNQCIALVNMQQPTVPVRWSQQSCYSLYPYVCKFSAAN